MEVGHGCGGLFYEINCGLFYTMVGIFKHFPCLGKMIDSSLLKNIMFKTVVWKCVMVVVDCLMR